MIANEFILGTIHRDHNTDDGERLSSIFEALLEIAKNKKIVLPLHPRTKKKMLEVLTDELNQEISQCANLVLIPPVSFLDMVLLEDSSSMIITDSGGVQKESYFFKKPCIILRPETEWVEIVESGSAVICDADKDKILNSFAHFRSNPPKNFPAIFGDGQASEFICKEIVNSL